jgi:hypothetical protein
MISSHSTLAGGRRQQRLTCRHRWFLSRQAPRGMRVASAAQMPSGAGAGVGVHSQRIDIESGIST